MPSFIMKARTHSDVGWYVFSIEDVPVLVEHDLFSVMRLRNSPLLRLSTVRRGDRDTMFFEGEVVSKDDSEWLVCYERGFYAINKDYVIRKLEDLTGAVKLGDVGFDRTFPITLSIKQKLLFKYRQTIFRMESICGIHDNKVLLRSMKRPIDPAKIKQDCGCKYNGAELYLGDVTDKGIVTLSYGIIGFVSNNMFTSLESVRKKDDNI